MGDLLGLEPEGEISPKRGCQKQEEFFLNHLFICFILTNIVKTMKQILYFQLNFV